MGVLKIQTLEKANCMGVLKNRKFEKANCMGVLNIRKKKCFGGALENCIGVVNAIFRNRYACAQKKMSVKIRAARI